MSNLLTLADSINAALNTGKEATFLHNGTLYTFSPDGIITWLAANDVDTVANVLTELTAGGDIIPVSTSNATGIVEMFGTGAPADEATASLTVNPTGDDNSLTYTAVTSGDGGNDITITYVDPSANDATLSVDVTGTDIVVNLATDSGGTITSTAADVLAEIEATPAAAALVTVAIDAADTGSGDDGSGVVTAMAEDALEGGVTGTGNGVAGTGSRYTRTADTITVYINVGDEDAPNWDALAFA